MNRRLHPVFLLFLAFVVALLLTAVLPISQIAYSADQHQTQDLQLDPARTITSEWLSGRFVGLPRALRVPKRVDATCSQLLVNSEFNPSGAAFEPWIVIEDTVYYNNQIYVSPQHSLFFADNDDGDLSPNTDAFAQTVTFPASLESVTIEYATLSLNANDPDLAFGSLMTLDATGNLYQMVSFWEMLDTAAEAWENHFFEITDSATLQQLQGNDIAVVFHNSTTGSDPAESVYFDDITLTACVPDPNDFIDVWYGDTQNFGQLGNPQQWVNILGTVTGPGITSLTYSLNNGPDQPLSIGPDIQRLTGAGDFNVEIDYADLNPGSNSVILKASDGVSETHKTVTVNYTAGQTWTETYDAIWCSSANIQDTAQAVDGKWQISGNSVTIDADNWGYDRLLAIGDETWADYEVTVPVTVYGIDPRGYLGVSNGPAVGFVMHWQGHSNNAGEQPNIDWFRSGAVGWYRWFFDYSEGLQLRSYSSFMGTDYSKAMQFNTPYIFKMSVQSVPDAPAYYRLKFWKAGRQEPLDWDLQGYTSETAATAGSLLLLAHHVDAEFGQVTVKNLDDLRLKVNVAFDGAGAVTFVPDQNDFGYSEPVQILALPAAGYNFTGWSGYYFGTGNPANFLIFKDMNITAHFAPNPPTQLTVTVDGQGSVMKDPDKVDYVWGEEVTLTALRAVDHLFLYWNGDLTGNQNPATVIMDADKQVTAVFAPASTITPKSDVFSQCELDADLWTLVNPTGDARLEMTSTQARFIIPAGSVHNMWGSSKDALRIMQPTQDGDFAVEVKFDTLPSQKYQIEGILIQQDDDNWLRYDFHHDGVSSKFYAAETTNGSSMALRVTEVDPGSATSVYLRVERIGEQWTFSHSFNGTDWSVFLSSLHQMAVTSSGVYVGNAATVPGTEPEFIALLDYFFNTVAPADNVGPGSITIAKQTEPAGAASFSFDGELGSFSLDDGGSQIFTDLCTGDYLVNEIVSNGWLLDRVECNSANVSWIDNSVTIQLDAGEVIGCTFVNHRIAFTAEPGWNMVSSNIEPAVPNMWDVFNPILDDVILVKGGNGEVFWPAYNVNNIGDWDVTAGYQLFMNAPAALIIAGTELDPGTPIDLGAGWNLIAYLPGTSLPVETALATVAGQLVLAKDGDGNVYWPDQGINSIGDMEPGKGYQLNLTAPKTLVYMP